MAFRPSCRPPDTDHKNLTKRVHTDREHVEWAARFLAAAYLYLFQRRRDRISHINDTIYESSCLSKKLENLGHFYTIYKRFAPPENILERCGDAFAKYSALSLPELS
jgi:hypothetical protein